MSIFLFISCGGGGEPALDIKIDETIGEKYDIEEDTVELPDEKDVVAKDIVEIEELLDAADLYDPGTDSGEGVSDIVEISGSQFRAWGFSGGFQEMKGGPFSLAIGVSKQPLGKKTELKSANYRLKAGFLSAIKN
ncbi:MAG: hypothetical protein FJ088_02335 [Deltaproteobacteria bacterium]|nr:hypothetical protein [Deltaproteobacteria bacterium]